MRLCQEIGRRLSDALTSLLAYRELRESEHRFRLVFENSPVAIGEEDFSGVKSFFDGLRRDGVTDIGTYFAEHPEAARQCAARVKFVDVNRAALVLHATESKEELLARMAETFTAETLEVFRQGLVCLWNGGTEMRRDAVVKTLAGDLRHVAVYFSVCPGYEQTLSRVLVSLADITERKRAEAALRQSEAGLQLALEAGQLGDWHWNISSREIVWSARCKALYGLRPEEDVTYERFLATLHPDDRERTIAALKRAVETRADYDVEKRVVWPDGSVHWTASRGRVFCDAAGQPLNMAGVTMGVTDRKRTEAELLRLNQELDQRVKERTVELEIKNKELERLNKLFVGRELRMAELKRRLKELERQSQGGESKTGA